MIWGVEGRHLWIPPTLAATLTLPGDLPVDPETATVLGINYRTDDSGVRVWPRYHVHKISGLLSTGDSGDRRDNRVGAEGEIPRRSIRRGKTITYEGVTVATSRVELRAAEAALVAAFTDQSAEGFMVVTPHPLMEGSGGSGGGGSARYYPARALTVDIDDEIKFSPRRPSRGHESLFVIALRNARAGGYSYFDESGVGYP